MKPLFEIGNNFYVLKKYNLEFLLSSCNVCGMCIWNHPGMKCVCHPKFSHTILKKLLKLSKVSKLKSILKHTFKSEHSDRFRTPFFLMLRVKKRLICTFTNQFIPVKHHFHCTLAHWLYLYPWTTHVPQIVLPFLLSGPSAVLWAATIFSFFPLSTTFRLNKAFVKAEIIAKACSAVMCFCDGSGIFFQSLFKNFRQRW